MGRSALHREPLGMNGPDEMQPGCRPSRLAKRLAPLGEHLRVTKKVLSLGNELASYSPRIIPASISSRFSRRASAPSLQP